MKKYYSCKIHGDLSSKMDMGGAKLYGTATNPQMLEKITDETFCPKCFSQWLAMTFPVELIDEPNVK